MHSSLFLHPKEPIIVATGHVTLVKLGGGDFSFRVKASCNLSPASVCVLVKVVYRLLSMGVRNDIVKSRPVSII